MDDIRNESLEAIETANGAGFTVHDDKTADWAGRAIKRAAAERDRLLLLVAEERSDLAAQEKLIIGRYEAETAWLLQSLRSYMGCIADDAKKETKTQRSYRLLNCTLVEKKPSVELVRDEAALVNWAKSTGRVGLIKTKEAIAWADLKAQLIPDAVSGVCVLADTGEVVDGATAQITEGGFSVK